MSLDNLAIQSKPILAPHEVFYKVTSPVVLPAQNAASYLAFASAELSQELKYQVLGLKNSLEDTVGNALAKIKDTGRMSYEDESQLATLIMTQAQYIADKLSSMRGIGQHIPYSFKGEFVPVSSKHKNSDLLSSNYGGVIGGGIGARRMQKKIPQAVQKQLGEIDIML